MVPWTAPSVAVPFYGKATFLPYHVFIIEILKKKKRSELEKFGQMYILGENH